MKLKVHCREASRLLSAAYERDLTFGESLSLGAHLTLCAMCRNFNVQLKFVQKAAGKFRDGP